MIGQSSVALSKYHDKRVIFYENAYLFMNLQGKKWKDGEYYNNLKEYDPDVKTQKGVDKHVQV